MTKRTLIELLDIAIQAIDEPEEYQRQNMKNYLESQYRRALLDDTDAANYDRYKDERRLDEMYQAIAQECAR